MTDWQTMDTAPRDGTPVQARIPGHGEDNIIAWTDGFVDQEGSPLGTWHFVGDQKPPDCWTDGICWDRNEDDEPSVRPTHWRHLP